MLNCVTRDCWKILKKMENVVTLPKVTLNLKCITEKKLQKDH